MPRTAKTPGVQRFSVSDKTRRIAAVLAHWFEDSEHTKPPEAAVDEIIFRADNPANRLMLELMARGGRSGPGFAS